MLPISIQEHHCRSFDFYAVFTESGEFLQEASVSFLFEPLMESAKRKQQLGFMLSL